ncbi:ABC transporter ATP-binding protein [Thalassolituus marinus]|uniref:ABC transporter ATP-binding protein n=1 Tax=Thalassolituus marinus TaxID=671053 RepID=A0ABS7ZQQ8_9GAMM|nr:ABC transporter ATP-binding protein [Thalassolituus marinus]MCA6064048.1 ABC transporter ATP-binding protein [Thalassolituus marinus]
MSDVVLKATGISKAYASGPQQVIVWQDIDLQVAAGETLAIVGASGSGKTTLLNALGGLDVVDGGEVEVAGCRLQQLTEGERTRLRNQQVGFVYQFHHLLPEFTALENVMMPQLLAGASRKEASDKARRCLEQLGLGHRIDHKPAELSGGERQRTAIARALVNEPALVLMDEPTGNLDENTARQVEEAMLALTVSRKTAFVLVTHDQTLAARMDRCLHLRDRSLHEMKID